jgi:hypothetical protein
LDFVEFSDGHYWLNEDLVVKVPLKLVGDEHNPANVVLESSGTIVWAAGAGWIEGMTIRRPKLSGSASASGNKIASLPIMRVEKEGRVQIHCSVLDNQLNKSLGHVLPASPVVEVVGSRSHVSLKSVHLIRHDGLRDDQNALIQVLDGSTLSS